MLVFGAWVLHGQSRAFVAQAVGACGWFGWAWVLHGRGRLFVAQAVGACVVFLWAWILRRQGGPFDAQAVGACDALGWLVGVAASVAWFAWVVLVGVWA